MSTSRKNPFSCVAVAPTQIDGLNATLVETLQGKSWTPDAGSEQQRPPLLHGDRGGI